MSKYFNRVFHGVSLRAQALPANPVDGDFVLDVADGKLKLFVVDTWKVLSFAA